MIQQADSPSLTILSGPQSGNTIPLEDETRIGSDVEAHVLIPSASPLQALIKREPIGYVVYDTGGAGVWLNDDRVITRRPMREGDVLWLGPPGDPASIMIQSRGLPPAPGAAATPAPAV